MHCKKCLHYEVCVKLGKPSLYGINQEIGCSAYKDKEKWAEKKDTVTNADRIRAMSDEVLASQLVQVFKEGIKVLTDMDMPEELLDKIWYSFLERLKQPAEGDVNNG